MLSSLKEGCPGISTMSTFCFKLFRTEWHLPNTLCNVVEKDIEKSACIS